MIISYLQYIWLDLRSLKNVDSNVRKRPFPLGPALRMAPSAYKDSIDVFDPPCHKWLA